jgi:hypothetical protein
VTALPGAVAPEGVGLDASSAAPVGNVSWTICCMDGATFSVAVPEDAPVAVLKRGISEVRGLPCFTMELFVKDIEEPLEDEKPLRSLDRAPLFLLLKQASDRLALEALFKSTGGAGWTEHPTTDWRHWMTEADLGEWLGVGVDLEGRVTRLYLEDSGMVGPIPSEVLQLSALQSLLLNHNELTGPIPAVLGQLRALTGLDLAENQLSGPIPAELGQLTALTSLELDYNQLSGLIPAELGQLGVLTSLRLGANQLSGPIPAELGQLTALTRLNLGSNQLAGLVPAELGQLGALTELHLGANQLTGQEAFREYMEEHHPDCVLGL